MRVKFALSSTVFKIAKFLNEKKKAKSLCLCMLLAEFRLCFHRLTLRLRSGGYLGTFSQRFVFPKKKPRIKSGASVFFVNLIVLGRSFADHGQPTATTLPVPYRVCAQASEMTVKDCIVHCQPLARVSNYPLSIVHYQLSIRLSYRRQRSR